MFWFFGLEACGILAPWPGIEPAPPALESKVPTTGPPGKSPTLHDYKFYVGEVAPSIKALICIIKTVDKAK